MFLNIFVPKPFVGLPLTYLFILVFWVRSYNVGFSIVWFGRVWRICAELLQRFINLKFLLLYVCSFMWNILTAVNVSNTVLINTSIIWICAFLRLYFMFTSENKSESIPPDKRKIVLKFYWTKNSWTARKGVDPVDQAA